MYEVKDIESTGRGTFRVRFDGIDGTTSKDFYAKDELEAFTIFQTHITKWKQNMRVFIVCATIVFLAVLASLTSNCSAKREQYSTDMRECLKAGKSYISEDDSFSCRDPFVRAVNAK